MRWLQELNDVFPICAAKRLQLNADKTEVLWFGPPSQLRQLSSVSSAITINRNIIKPSFVVRDLGILFDAELSMRQHVSRVSQTCFFYLRRICSVRRQLDRDVTAKLVTALVLSRLDHCNAVLVGLPATTHIAPLRLGCSTTYCSRLKTQRPCHSCFAGVALAADHRETVQAVPACAQDVRRARSRLHCQHVDARL